MKILNLYAGIGGNRTLWGYEHEITAIEYNENIAKVYQEQYPNDEVIVADAHQYLLDHYKDFDFIWSSPPCPTHSRMCFAKKKKQYIDLKLYQEIILLRSWFKGKWVVENVVPYYGYLIEPSVVLGRHPFWSNFDIKEKEFTNIDISRSKKEDLLKERMIDWSIFDCIKDVPENRSKENRFERLQLVRNMVNPKIGLHILNCAKEIIGKNKLEENKLF
jgi:DNA (cytosine-5)-methyltransferase 1